MITLTKDELNILCNEHVDRYTRLIEHYVLGTPVGRNVNVPECQMYLQIWCDTQCSLNTNGSIAEDGKQEIRDALHSGEYADIVPGSDKEYIFEYNGIKL